MAERWKKIFFTWIQRPKTRRELLVVLIVSPLYLLFVERTGIGVPCVFRLTTGYLCPGCGMTHAMIHLLHLDFRGAFMENPLSVTLFPLLLFYLLYRKTKKDDHFAPWELVFLGLGVVICIVFMVYRNWGHQPERGLYEILPALWKFIAR